MLKEFCVTYARAGVYIWREVITAEDVIGALNYMADYATSDPVLWANLEGCESVTVERMPTKSVDTVDTVEQCVEVLRTITTAEYMVQRGVEVCQAAIGPYIGLVDVRAALARMAFRNEVLITGRFVTRLPRET